MLKEDDKEEDVNSDYELELDEWYNSPYTSKSLVSCSSPFILQQTFCPKRTSYSHVKDDDMQMQSHTSNYFHKKSTKMIRKFVSYF